MPISFLFFRERKRKTVGRRAPAGKYGNILRKQDIRGDTHLCSHKQSDGGGIPKGGGGTATSHSLWSSLWLLSDEAESNIKKEKTFDIFALLFWISHEDRIGKQHKKEFSV